jgi:hypothetical protein
MEQANRLTLRSVSRPAPAGLGISNLDFTLFDRTRVTQRLRHLGLFGIWTPLVRFVAYGLNFRQRRRQLERRRGGLLEADCVQCHR